MANLSAPIPGYISNYTIIGAHNYGEDDHSELVSAILRGVSPDSHIYCKDDTCSFPEPEYLNGYNGNPPIYITTHSCYWNTSNSYTPYDKDFDNYVYNNGIAVFALAGNITTTDNVVTPGKGLNVITVGNYNDSDGTISSQSCSGNPETGNHKPEIAAPGKRISAGGHTSSGTSFATPHAAAFAADLLSAYPWMQLRPHMVKAFMLLGLQTVSTVIMTMSVWAE